MDYRIFNVKKDINACDCIRECTDTARESALKVDSWRKIPCHTGELNLHQQLADLKLYQLSYIPTPTHQALTEFVSGRVGMTLVC